MRTLRFRSSLPRYAVYLVAAAAIVRIVLPAAPAQSPAPPPPQRVTNTDLAAQSFAVNFTRAYLAYDASSPQTREALLAALIGRNSPALDQDANVQLPAKGSDQVTFAQVVAQQPAAGGTAYTVQADTTADGSVFLAVTVGRSKGALELVGDPAIVGPPAMSAALEDPATQDGQQVSDTAVTTVVTRALTNYLQGNEQNLQSDLATGVSVSVPTSTLRQVQVGQIDWLVQGRSVGVDVQANDRSGATYTLHYTLGLEHQASAGGRRWFISGIDSTPGS